MLGDAIRAEREKRGLSQAELARRAGLTSGHINLLEAGKRPNPTIDAVQAIAGALGITIDELLERAGLATEPPFSRLASEGVDPATLADLLAVLPNLSEDDRRRLVQTARAWAGRKPEQRRAKRTPAPTEPRQEPNATDGTHNDRAMARGVRRASI